jgi:hypothetical protein
MPYTSQLVHTFQCAGCGREKFTADHWYVFRNDPRFFVFMHWTEKMALTDKWDSACSIECLNKCIGGWGAVR